jgi:hypothetical protein
MPKTTPYPSRHVTTIHQPQPSRSRIAYKTGLNNNWRPLGLHTTTRDGDDYEGHSTDLVNIFYAFYTYC